jgi:S-adenosyl-L-methionine hydrolase (adenosine-forming)
MTRPLVALLTDFGTRDHYVGALKGAVLTVCPDANVVDVVHDIPAYDVGAGSYALAAAAPAFPARTVFLAVVDPEVGSSRRALAAAVGGQLFVGPDNGLLTDVLAANAAPRIHAITNAGLFRYEVSRTFHGRDIFAPVAGHLARGLPLEDVGPPAGPPVLLRWPQVVRQTVDEWWGEVLFADHFGNLITNFDQDPLAEILAAADEDASRVLVTVEGAILPLVGSYSEIHAGDPCALEGSSHRLEIAVNRGNAARTLGAAKGAPVRVRVLRSAIPT